MEVDPRFERARVMRLVLNRREMTDKAMDNAVSLLFELCLVVAMSARGEGDGSW